MLLLFVGEAIIKMIVHGFHKDSGMCYHPRYIYAAANRSECCVLPQARPLRI